jgi:hypothetical protein
MCFVQLGTSVKSDAEFILNYVNDLCVEMWPL